MLIHVDTSSLATERVSFRDFANALLNDESFRARIREAKQRAEQNGLPALRSALNWNTCDRIRAVMIGLYHTKLPASLNKTPLISRFVEHVESCVPQEFPRNVAVSVADIGVVHTTDDFLARGEIVYLRANATNNSQELCVNCCEHFVGWVFRNNNFVEVDWISKERIYYGKLVEKRSREYTIYN